MATKKIKAVLKLQIQAGKATPAPPIGPALGQHGVNIQEFVTKYNDKTKDKIGNVIPCILTIYEDRSFIIELKTPPVADSIKKAINLKKGSAHANLEKVGQVSRKVLREIATSKLADLNTNNIDAATRIVEGTAKSMGLEIKD
jgi:large subunit ribosomal protein L11